MTLVYTLLRHIFGFIKLIRYRSDSDTADQYNTALRGSGSDEPISVPRRATNLCRGLITAHMTLSAT